MDLRKLVTIGAIGLATLGCDERLEITGWNVKDAHLGVHGAQLHVQTNEDAICDYSARFGPTRFQRTNDETHTTPVLLSDLYAYNKTEVLFRYHIDCFEDGNSGRGPLEHADANVQFSVPR